MRASRPMRTDEIEPRFRIRAGSPPREFGLIDLVEEFTALRHELKLQTKSGRGLIEQTENTIVGAAAGDRPVAVRRAQGSTGRLGGGQGAGRSPRRPRRGPGSRRARNRESPAPDRRRVGARPGNVRRPACSAGNPGSAAGFCGRTIDEVVETIRRDGQARHELFDSFLEGYGLIQKRLRRALASEQVAHIACEGKPVDPELMTVIEVVDEPRDRPGTVVKELRRGYTWRGRVIRFAEVQAVRGAWKSPAAPDEAKTQTRWNRTKPTSRRQAV